MRYRISCSHGRVGNILNVRAREATPIFRKILRIGSRARYILKHAPETAKLVRDGHPNCGGWRTPRDYFPVVFPNPPPGRCLPRFRTAKFKIICIIMNKYDAHWRHLYATFCYLFMAYFR